jgi:hypothetical protein
VTKSKAALARKIVIPAKSSGKPQLSLGTLKLVARPELRNFTISNKNHAGFPRDVFIANLSIFATLNDQKRNFNARFSPEAKR